MSQPFLFTRLLCRTLRVVFQIKSVEYVPLQSRLSHYRFSTRTCDYAFEILPDWPILFGFDLFCTSKWAEKLSGKLGVAKGVSIELQNLGDARVSREIVASIEHALSQKSGEWRVSIAGSIASENWEMKVEGPNGFRRSYTLTGAAGEHEPEAICRLILQLVPAAC